MMSQVNASRFFRVNAFFINWSRSIFAKSILRFFFAIHPLISSAVLCTQNPSSTKWYSALPTVSRTSIHQAILRLLSVVDHFLAKYNFMLPSVSALSFCLRYSVHILQLPETRLFLSVLKPTRWIVLPWIFGGRKYGNMVEGTKSTKASELSMTISVAAISLSCVSMMISVATMHHFPVFQLSGENLISVAVLTQSIMMSVAIQRIFFITDRVSK